MATEPPRHYRAVFDTNVIVAALRSQNPSSPTVELLARWEAGEFDLLYSDALRAEYADKLKTRVKEQARAESFLQRLDRTGIRVEVAQVDHVIVADPDDDMVLACAVAGQADCLVTYDPHFLPLIAAGETYRGVRIMNGLRFLYLVRGDKP